MIVPGFNDLATLNPTLLADWDYDRNRDLDPTSLSPNAHGKAWWKCATCGLQWHAQIKARNRGTGCPECGKKKQTETLIARKLQSVGSLASNNPELAAQWHPTRNGDLSPEDVLPNANRKAWWRCPTCRIDWEAYIASRNQGVGCPECGKMKSVTARHAQRIADGNTLAEVNPELASQWHPTRNGDLTPSDVAPNSNKKAWWRCDRGHDWKAVINSRNSGVGCPKCSIERHSSFPEQAVWFYVKQLVTSENRARVLGKELDIFVPSLQVGIEYDGSYYHSTARSRARDEAKTQHLTEHGINVYRIVESTACSANVKDRTIRYVPTKDGSSLEEPVRTLCEWLFGRIPEGGIDVLRDTAQILEQLVISEKEGSIAVKCPDSVSIWNAERNGRVRPEFVRYGSSRLYWWKCDFGHEWRADPYSVYQGKRCPFCSGHRVLPGFNDLQSANPALASQWHPTKNGDLTPAHVTPGSNRKAWWACERDHEWKAVISSRSGGTGCPVCSGHRILPGFNDLAKRNPALLAEWDYDRNGDIDPTSLSPTTHKKVWWKCLTCGNGWRAEVGGRHQGNGCPKCGRKKQAATFVARKLQSVGSLADNNPELAAQWHPTKNSDLSPEDVLPNTNRKAWWLCPECLNEWEANVASRNQGVGCPECGKQRQSATLIARRLRSVGSLAANNPELAGQWHPRMNNDLSPEDVLPNTNRRAWWQCPKCGHEWQASVASRNKGVGCPECGKKRAASSANITRLARGGSLAQFDTDRE